MELKDMAPMIEQMKTNIASIEAKAEAQGTAGAEALKLAQEAKTQLTAIEAKQGITPDELKTQLSEHGKTFQAQFDELATKIGKGVSDNGEIKTLGRAIKDELSDKFFKNLKHGEQGQSDMFKMFNSDKQAKVRFELDAKTLLMGELEAKTMTLSGNLTGVAFATQDPRAIIFPSQKLNARDLINTFQTDTGLYVYWKEDTGETNNIAFQVEGSVKGSNDYSFTAVSVVQGYLAGTCTFSKQMVNSLPFLTQTLPRMLMRDFYKKENARFNTVISGGATGDTSITSTTDNVEKLIYTIGNQLVANYNASFIVVNPADYAKLFVSTYSKGYYPGAGSVQFNGTALTISGVPVFQAAWATAARAMVIDQDFVERVQTSGLAIELSYEEGNNFTKNLVTARIECQEEFILQLPPSAIYQTLA
jgi:hypothetical protein